eukprot:6211388-Pleurochrysis_carterae.AAC.1
MHAHTLASSPARARTHTLTPTHPYTRAREHPRSHARTRTPEPPNPPSSDCSFRPSRFPQEDKQALFDTLETVDAALKIASGVLSTLTPQPTRMREALNSFMLATDLSEYLVRKGDERSGPHYATRTKRGRAFAGIREISARFPRGVGGMHKGDFLHARGWDLP